MTSYTFRLDEQLKRDAFAVFESYGLNPSQALNMILKQVADTKTVPINLDRQPNAFNFDLARMEERLNDTFHEVPNQVEDVPAFRRWLAETGNGH